MKHPYYNFIEFLPFNPLNHTQVWLATDSHCQKNLLIKQLKQGFNSLQFEQFYQEYKVYQKIASLLELEKNYFAEYLEFYEQNSEYFLVVTYYEGNTLKQTIAESQFNFYQKIMVLIQMCQAVEIFHLLGFIHCDIKPSNILIIENQVKLLDFGLAKKVGENLNVNNFTAGTPAYMSPEQFTGGEITYQTDYYSLSIVMYELLLGQKPFVAGSMENWAICHCQSPVPKTTIFSHDQNQILNHIFTLLLAKFAVNRPQNLSQTIALLKNLLKE